MTQKTDRIPIAGIHSVRTALQGQPQEILEVWLWRDRRDRRLGALAKQALALGIRLRQRARADLDRAAEGIPHQGALAWVRIPKVGGEPECLSLLATLGPSPLVLVLDGVQDPHNLGACLRTADGAGVQAVLTPRDRAVGLTPAVCKVASGAARSVPYFQVTNLARTLDRLRARGFWLLGLAAEADRSLYQSDLQGPLALILGGEGKGLRRLIRERCDLLVHLPMRGAVESLNVSVATGIVLYEALRQRQSFPQSGA